MGRVLLLLALLAAAPAAAQTPLGAELAGPARALDGDTIWLDGRRVRLWGIDAPEMTEWPLGALARALLDRLLDGRTVTCTVVDTDRYKRPVAWCVRSGDDLGLALGLLMAGRAVVHRRYTLKASGELAEMAAIYDQAEAAAQAAGRGLWARR